MRSTVSKMMLIVKATVFLVGFTVTLALLFGVASTALAHIEDRGFFHLNHSKL